ncbi:ABC transporter ATP-binding protein [Mycolicibacterium nivoides]|uniref:ABC transporter ATP-binding protein n=1 Tax=Mycolicibacterium nivoides TaxID=2487344 RepID=UPI003C2F4098
MAEPQLLDDGPRKPVLSVDSVTKTFQPHGRRSKPVHALNRISMDIAPREWLGIVGESGSGKSTLARIIARLEVPTTGTVSLDGVDVTSWPGGRMAFARRVQFMYQNSLAAMNPRLTVGQIISEPMRLHRLTSSSTEQEARVVALLDDVNLKASLIAKRPRQLSGGQCQRVALARALALEPDVLLLDEPTSALDVSVQAQIIALLGDIQRDRGLTIVVISHDLALVSQTCHRVAVLHRGDLVELGETAQVIEHPEAPYTRTLLDAVPRIATLAESV